MLILIAIGAAASAPVQTSTPQASTEATDKQAATEARGVRTVQDAIAALESDQRRGARVAVPDGDLTRWFGPDSYPAEALRAGEQGRVVAQLAIADDGRVSDCTIHESSGSASLDRTTCSIALTRLSFRPPHDRRGRAVSSNYLLPVRWVLPTEATALDAGQLADYSGDLTVEYVVAADGTLASCRVVSGATPKAGGPEACPAQRIGRPFSRPWQRNGQPVRVRIVRREVQSVTVEP